MPVKRLRIIAGPNGSGKSTFIQQIQSTPPTPRFGLGYYVNADDIEREIKTNGFISFEKFGIHITTSQLQSYFKKSQFAPVKLDDVNLWQSMEVTHNNFQLLNKKKINSYIAADLAEFIRIQLLKQEHSFSYETVMSDKRKINFLKKAKAKGYKIYLYYFATEDPQININRVLLRVAQKGHPVKSEIIKKRYYKSLENMRAAIKLSDRAYLFDNSQKASVLISEITDGHVVTIIDPENVPNWVVKYLSKPNPAKNKINP